jgi:hypothetical protein
MPAVQTEVNRVIENLEHASARQREVLSALQTDTVEEIGQLREDVTVLQTHPTKRPKAENGPLLEERLVGLLKERGGMTSEEQHQLAGMYPEAGARRVSLTVNSDACVRAPQDYGR